MSGSYLGPDYSQNFIENELKKVGAVYNVFNEQKIIDQTVNEILNNKVIGWFQGRMEFGPRALGNRSIIGDQDPLLCKKS